MKYMGSKARIAKHILPIVLEDREIDQWYVEPFVGGANTIDKVEGLRLGADLNKYLICFWKAFQNGWVPPEHLSKEEYYYIKENIDLDKKLSLWAGICCSYGGKWFGGWVDPYSKDGRDRQTESRNSVLRQLQKIKNVHFVHSSYTDLVIPENSIIYCDPPYKGATPYKDKFDHELFWEWCRVKSQNNKVFISEYSAPKDFIAIREVIVDTPLSNSGGSGNRIRVEKLFKFDPMLL